MKRIVIIGAGYAGRTIALRLKEYAQVTVCEEEKLLCVRENFFPWLAKKTSAKNLAIVPEKFFSQQGISFIQAKVEKVYPLKKEVSLENKDRLPYELLIIAAGSVSACRESLAGDAKRGVFYLAHNDPRQMLETFADAAYVIVEAHTLMGIMTAVLVRRNFAQKEVRLFIKNASLREIVPRHFSEEKLLVHEEEITECIGDGMLRAVRLNTGKVYAADMLFLDTGLLPNTGLFGQFGFFKIEQNAFVVDASLKTTLDDVFALGDAVNRDLAVDRFLFRTNAYIDNQIERLTRAITRGPSGPEEVMSAPLSDEEKVLSVKAQMLAP